MYAYKYIKTIVNMHVRIFVDSVRGSQDFYYFVFGNACNVGLKWISVISARLAIIVNCLDSKNWIINK